jgi:hypothetical protein
MSLEMAFVSTDFDVFAHKPVQETVQETIEVYNKPITTVDQTDLEFSFPADSESQIDRKLHMSAVN